MEDSVAAPREVTGQHLHDSFVDTIRRLSLSLVQFGAGAIRVGPLELLRFGPAVIVRHSVEWPIEGGILTRAAGGTFRIGAAQGRLVASVEAYRPMLPTAVYALTQLPVHHAISRLQLLRARGREPLPGVPASSDNRARAAAVDLAFCATLAGLAGRRRHLPVLIGVAAAYHLACWTMSGRTLGGVVTGQRVMSIDGSRMTVGQSIVRLLTLPMSWVLRRSIHDEISGAEVIVD